MSLDNLSGSCSQLLHATLRASQHPGDYEGCELVYLPSYSPYSNLLEEAFCKIQGLMRKVGARSREVCSRRWTQRLQTKTPVAAWSIVASVQRFNRCNRCCSGSRKVG